MLFEKLLVPLDGTAESAVALPIARAMARATGATVTLLRVLAADEEDRTTREAQRELDGIAAELTAGGLTARTVVQTGDPAQTIVSHARMGEADLIVMRTHGRAGLARAVVGSVAERILTQSPVPLLLVRPGDRYVSQIKSLLVPVDGSPGAALALGAAIGLAQATGASLRLVQVVVPIPPTSMVPTCSTAPPMLIRRGTTRLGKVHRPTLTAWPLACAPAVWLLRRRSASRHQWPRQSAISPRRAGST